MMQLFAEGGKMRVFAFKNTLSEIKNSSSGGAFIACCQSFEKRYGVGNVAFCGAELKSDMSVAHCIVYSAKECKKFQGSKYVKSSINHIYQEVEKLLLKGKAVLFSGTPCQVAALKAVLSRKGVSLDKLLTLDVICHGTPDVRVWNAYKIWLENKAAGKLIDYSFRYKPAGWRGYPAYAEFDNGIKMIDTKETSVYSKLHLSGLSITQGCFKCPYSNMNRVSDITLGDFWGIEEEHINIDSKNGVSLVITNTNRGFNIASEINREGTLVPVTGTGFIKYQHNLMCATKKPERYDDFWLDMNNQEFEKILQDYLGYGWKYTLKFSMRYVCKKSGVLELYRKVKRKKQ